MPHGFVPKKETMLCDSNQLLPMPKPNEMKKGSRLLGLRRKNHHHLLSLFFNEAFPLIIKQDG